MRILNALPGLLLFAATAAVAQNNPAELCGTWRMSVASETPGQPPGESPSAKIATLKLELVYGQLAGTWTSRHAAYPVRDLVYINREFSFAFDLDPGDGTKLPMVYKGMLVGDRMVGRLTTPRSTKAVNGERAVEPPADAPPPGT